METLIGLSAITLHSWPYVQQNCMGPIMYALLIIQWIRSRFRQVQLSDHCHFLLPIQTFPVLPACNNSALAGLQLPSALADVIVGLNFYCAMIGGAGISSPARPIKWQLPVPGIELHSPYGAIEPLHKTTTMALSCQWRATFGWWLPAELHRLWWWCWWCDVAMGWKFQSILHPSYF